MGFSFRAVWSEITKRWAYFWASCLCLVVIGLLGASCGTSWYEYTYSGNMVFQLQNASAGAPGYLPQYGAYFEVYDYFLKVSTTITVANNPPQSQDCDYTSSECTNLAVVYYNLIANSSDGPCSSTLCKTTIQPPWDVSKYQASYSAMFAFTLCAILLVVVLGILLQVICWTYDRINGKITLVLFIISIVLVSMILICLLIVWTILFGHDRFMRDSLDVSDELCAGGQTTDKETYGNVLCTWNGQVEYDSNLIRYDQFYNFNWINVATSWGPNNAWICSTIGFGLVGFIFLLIVGWRPPFKL